MNLIFIFRQNPYFGACLRYREALCYSAFIADLDPVATLAAFGKLRVDALLSTLVSGEATLNDPVAIVTSQLCRVDFEFAF